jgi:hypothetical protein
MLISSQMFVRAFLCAWKAEDTIKKHHRVFRALKIPPRSEKREAKLFKGIFNEK